MKQCNTCGEWKPPSDYRNPKGTRPAKCQACRWEIDQARYKRRHERNWSNPEYREKHKLRYRYNTLVRRGAKFEDWQEFLDWGAKEDCGCEICGSFNKLCIDHDHKTGRVRGILCQGCNQAIGCVSESGDRLQKAIGYLQRFEVSDGVGEQVH
jgi:hypothetical protein